MYLVQKTIVQRNSIFWLGIKSASVVVPRIPSFKDQNKDQERAVHFFFLKTLKHKITWFIAFVLYTYILTIKNIFPNLGTKQI